MIEVKNNDTTQLNVPVKNIPPAVDDKSGLIPEDFLKSIAKEHEVSQRELKVLLNSMSGKSTQTIAKELQISEDLVRKRLSDLYKKFNIEGRGPVKLAKLQQLLLTSYQKYSKESRHQQNQDWNLAPDVSVFYGREEALEKIKNWVLQENCHLVSIVGLEGTGKTSLSVKLAKEIEEEFEFILWRSLHLTPTLSDLLKDLNGFLGKYEETPIPTEINESISKLIDYLRQNRVLLILDGVESILQPGQLTGDYLETTTEDEEEGEKLLTYKDYGEFFRRVGESSHQSCVIITSLETPKEIALLVGETSPVRSYKLDGLQYSEARSILESQQLVDQDSWQVLINNYLGNAAALKIISQSIRELFNGKVAEFLEQQTLIFGGISNILNPSFSRISHIEKEILYWLAIEGEPVSFAKMLSDIPLAVSQKELLEALKSLEDRSLIEITPKDPKEGKTTYFTLEPLILEYVTNKLIAQISNMEDAEDSLSKKIPPAEELIELTPSEKKPVNLTKWFNGEFEIGWQPLSSLYRVKPLQLAPKLRSTFSLRDHSYVKRFKEVCFDSIDKQVALLVAETKDASGKIEIRVQIQPVEDQNILPNNLKLRLLSDSGSVLREVQSASEDNFIQLPRFRGMTKENFSVQVELEGNSHTEDFVI